MKKEFYTIDSEKYILESINCDMTKFNLFLEKEISKFKNPTILDLGFGSGRDMLYLLSKGLNVEGVDNCDNFIEKGLTVSKQTMPELNLNKKFDLIYSVGVIFHLNKEERIKLFKNIKNHLSENGVLVLSYNTLDRTTDQEREFFLVSEKEINEETGLNLINQEIMKDGKRDFNWITSSFKK